MLDYGGTGYQYVYLRNKLFYLQLSLPRTLGRNDNNTPTARATTTTTTKGATKLRPQFRRSLLSTYLGSYASAQTAVQVVHVGTLAVELLLLLRLLKLPFCVGGIGGVDAGARDFQVSVWATR